MQCLRAFQGATLAANLEIVPDQADIVRRIFREYIAGKTPRAIAAALNAEGVPPSRKRYWRAASINGHTRRKTGILQNELYCGRLIWNRCHRVNDPDTGKRIWRYNPESEWHRKAAPKLRIIEDDLFETAQRLRAERAKPHGRTLVSPKRILSGLLRCGECGAGMSKKDTDHGRPRIVCTQMREAGTCGNRRVYYLDDIERIVIGGFRQRWGSRVAIDHFVKCYNEERRRQADTGDDRRQVLADQVAALDRQIKRAVAAIIAGRITDEEAGAHLPGLRQQRAAAAAALHEIERGAIDLAPAPAAVDVFLRDLAQLEGNINARLAMGIDGAARTIRGLIETVTIQPTAAAGTTPRIVVKGALSSLLNPRPFREGPSVGRSEGAGCPSTSDGPTDRIGFTLILGLPRAA